MSPKQGVVSEARINYNIKVRREKDWNVNDVIISSPHKELQGCRVSMRRRTSRRPARHDGWGRGLSLARALQTSFDLNVHCFEPLPQTDRSGPSNGVSERLWRVDGQLYTATGCGASRRRHSDSARDTDSGGLLKTQSYNERRYCCLSPFFLVRGVFLLHTSTFTHVRNKLHSSIKTRGLKAHPLEKEAT